MGTYASYASLARELNALFYSTAAPTRTASESEIARIHFRVSFSYRLRTAQRMARGKKNCLQRQVAHMVVGVSPEEPGIPSNEAGGAESCPRGLERPRLEVAL